MGLGSCPCSLSARAPWTISVPARAGSCARALAWVSDVLTRCPWAVPQYVAGCGPGRHTHIFYFFSFLSLSLRPPPAPPLLEGIPAY